MTLWMIGLVWGLQWLMSCRERMLYLTGVPSAIKSIDVTVGGVISVGITLILLCWISMGMCVD